MNPISSSQIRRGIGPTTVLLLTLVFQWVLVSTTPTTLVPSTTAPTPLSLTSGCLAYTASNFRATVGKMTNMIKPLLLKLKGSKLPNEDTFTEYSKISDKVYQLSRVTELFQASQSDCALRNLQNFEPGSDVATTLQALTDATPNIAFDAGGKLFWISISSIGPGQYAYTGSRDRVPTFWGEGLTRENIMPIHSPLNTAKCHVLKVPEDYDEDSTFTIVNYECKDEALTICERQIDVDYNEFVSSRAIAISELDNLIQLKDYFISAFATMKTDLHCFLPHGTAASVLDLGYEEPANKLQELILGADIDQTREVITLSHLFLSDLRQLRLTCSALGNKATFSPSKKILCLCETPGNPKLVSSSRDIPTILREAKGFHSLVDVIVSTVAALAGVTSLFATLWALCHKRMRNRPNPFFKFFYYACCCWACKKDTPAPVAEEIPMLPTPATAAVVKPKAKRKRRKKSVSSSVTSEATSPEATTSEATSLSEGPTTSGTSEASTPPPRKKKPKGKGSKKSRRRRSTSKGHSPLRKRTRSASSKRSRAGSTKKAPKANTEERQPEVPETEALYPAIATPVLPDANTPPPLLTETPPPDYMPADPPQGTVTTPVGRPRVYQPRKPRPPAPVSTRETRSSVKNVNSVTSSRRRGVSWDRNIPETVEYYYPPRYQENYQDEVGPGFVDDYSGTSRTGSSDEEELDSFRVPPYRQ